eukprot:scaffold22566_cov60-Attheya_sp.AAC.1
MEEELCNIRMRIHWLASSPSLSGPPIREEPIREQNDSVVFWYRYAPARHRISRISKIFVMYEERL